MISFCLHNRSTSAWSKRRTLISEAQFAKRAADTITLRNLAAARWARSFATLWNCGVPISTALEVSSQSALNACYEKALLRAALQTRQGVTLYESLASTQLLPNYLLDIIRTGEMSGSLGTSLDHFASLLEEEAFAKATQQFVAILMGGQILGFVLMLHTMFP